MLKKNLLFIILLGILLSGTFGVFTFRWDLTKEKRYTLSPSSVEVLKKIKSPLEFDVYLEGDFPSSFKQLQSETKFLLEEFRKINPNIDFKFIDPIQKKMSKDTLMAMGMQPSILPDSKDGKVSEIVLFPYAVAKYKDKGVSIPLIIQQAGISAEDQLNRSIENLEYNFISSIKNIYDNHSKNVGILTNQAELNPLQLRGFISMLLENYNVKPIIPKNQKELSLQDLPQLRDQDALIIAKPRKPFTDNEKVILDQYMMNGGKTFWMVDAVNAEMDTLFRSKQIMAYPTDLNLTDFFFNYGVRINSTLVKDLQRSALLRLQTGVIAGNPQYSSFLWPYFTLGIGSENKNPITKNINPVKFEFPASIDTLQRAGLKKEILYQSSDRTLLKTVPNLISLNEIVRTDSIGEMERPSLPKIYALSVSGQFQSAYASRSESSTFPQFRAKSKANNKMIIISDGDIARNQIIKGKPLPLGYDIMNDQKYGNEQFLKNAMEYLLDDANLISLRNRNIEARLLDRQRINDEKTSWQWLNLLFAPFIIVGCALLYYRVRKKRALSS